ncbi:hypothetical protein GCM10018953_29680 [Streptosporangium nondiastaticum]
MDFPGSPASPALVGPAPSPSLPAEAAAATDAPPARTTPTTAAETSVLRSILIRSVPSVSAVPVVSVDARRPADVRRERPAMPVSPY